MANGAFFLDRDGTLNVDTGYVHSMDAWQWIAGVPEALVRLSQCGLPLIVVSNQSGIARKLFTEDDLHALETWVDGQLARFSVLITAWYHCPHLPEITGPCHCRKPAPGMLLKAAHDYRIDLTKSWMLGDKISDVLAGKACGCRTIKLGSGKSAEDIQTQAHGAIVVPDLPSALPFLLKT